MAAASGATTAPLRLKDLLELDCDSCSAAGFRCYPRRLLGEPATMRHLLAPTPATLPSLPRRRPGKLSHLSRSLSRRLSRGGFWCRRDGDDDAAAVPDVVCGSDQSGASPSETTSDDSSSGRRASRCGSDSDFSTASSASDNCMDAAAAVAATAGDEHEAMKRESSSGSEADDKEEQLSPVGVMDFPFDDDEGEDGGADGERDAGACSPSFSLARLQRGKMLRQHKIRRFGSMEELGPVDLEARLAATTDPDDLADDVPAPQVVIQRRDEDAAAARTSSGHDTEEHGLLDLLMDAGVDRVSERLLLDFFVEMKRRGGSKERHPEEISAPVGLLRRNAELLGDGEVLAAARDWLDVAGSERRWGLNDVLRGGEAVLAEMERGWRWMQVGEEERELGEVVGRMLADLLVEEVVWDLLL